MLTLLVNSLAFCELAINDTQVNRVLATERKTKSRAEKNFFN